MRAFFSGQTTLCPVTSPATRSAHSYKETMLLINGETQTYLAANDRSVQFGDGCFTTARVVEGKVRFLSDHLARLTLGCQRLMIPWQDESVLVAEMQQLAQDQGNGVLKVIISRGAAGRGYSPLGCDRPVRVISTSTLPAHFAQWQQEGVSLALSPIPLGCNPYLAGIKHLNRLEQVLIRAHLDQMGAQEALVLDSEGWLTECCAANLFWRQGNAVFTPIIDRAGVAGTMRNHIINTLAGSRWSVNEVRAKPDVLADAEEVLICNALLPLAPVRQAGEWHYTSRTLYSYLSPLCE